MARTYTSRTKRAYLIDFCASWICEGDKEKQNELTDIQAVIEGRIADYDQRGFELGSYYNELSKDGFKRLVNAIKKEVTARRRYRFVTGKPLAEYPKPVGDLQLIQAAEMVRDNLERLWRKQTGYDDAYFPVQQLDQSKVVDFLANNYSILARAISNHKSSSE